MKLKLLLYSIVISGYSCCFAQREIQPEIGGLVYTSQKGYYERSRAQQHSGEKIILSDNTYSGLNLRLGARFLYGNKSALVNLQYQFLQNNGFGRNDADVSLRSKFMGVGGDFRLFEQKRVGLFFQMALLTEVSTNYKDQYLEDGSYRPRSYAAHDFYNDYAYRNIYKGTPFIGNLSLGCNVRIMYGLSLNLSFGYGLRILRSQLVKLDFNTYQQTGIPTKITDVNDSYLIPFHMMDLQAGLSYSFSFKKNEKNKEQTNSFFKVFKSGVNKLSNQIVQPEIGTSAYVSSLGFFNVKKTPDDEAGKSKGLRLSNSSYYGIKAFFGARFISNKSSLSLNFQYQYVEDSGKGLEGNRILLKSNLLGLGAEVRLFEENKVRLFFKMTTLTEVSSNFINSYLKLGSYEPTDFDLTEKYIENPTINVYKGTPLLNTISIGSNIKLMKGLSLNLALGYTMRLIKIEYSSMSFNADQITGLFRDNPALIPIHMLDFQVGLNYAFPIKKQPKAEMP